MSTGHRCLISRSFTTISFPVKYMYGATAAFKEVDFMPFNPTDKRTEATIKAPDGSVFKVTKGAPQVRANDDD